MQEVLAKYPTLNQAGYKAFGKDPIREESRIFKPARIAFLMKAIPHILKPRKTQNTRGMTSYGLKHYIEYHTGDYLTNGECILAMILLGYTPKFFEGCINCTFNYKALTYHEWDKDKRPYFHPVSHDWYNNPITDIPTPTPASPRGVVA